MKRGKKYIAVLGASLMIGAALAGAVETGSVASAAEDNPAVIYDGNQRELHLENAADRDLFADFKGMMPGDKVTQQITVGVEHTDGPVTVYLTPGPAAMEDPENFAHVRLTVRADGRVVSSETLDDLTQIPDSKEAGVELYTFETPGEETLEATLEVDTEAGNELMDAQANVKWIFTVQDYSSGNTVRIRAMDLTAYTGGDSMDDDSFPAPRYYIDAPKGVELEDLTFYEDGSEAFTISEKSEDGEIIPELNETYTYQSEEEIVTPSTHDALPGLYEIGIEQDGHLTAEAGGVRYSVVYEPGILTVRYVTDPEGVLNGSDDIAVPVFTADDAQTSVESAGKTGGESVEKRVVGVVSNDTEFRTNGKTDIAGLTEEDTEGQISLMCDDILSLGTDLENRVDQMTDRAEEFLTDNDCSLEQRQYEYKYLDLINEHDGNAWVSSTKGVDVYYPYPEGTSYETAGETVFMILHFKDLHREYGFESGETIEQLIDTCKIEAMQVETTPYGLKFHVPESGFSPFALTWQPKDLASGLDVEGSHNADAEVIAGKDEQSGNVQTGDTVSVTGWILATAAAMLFILLLSALKRHRDDELKK